MRGTICLCLLCLDGPSTPQRTMESNLAHAARRSGRGRLMVLSDGGTDSPRRRLPARLISCTKREASAMSVCRVRRKLDERRHGRRPLSQPRSPAASPRWRSQSTTGCDADTDEPPSGGPSLTSATGPPPFRRIPSANNNCPWSRLAVPPFRTIEVDLSILKVELPRTHTGMVLAQPHLDLTRHEPYRCTNSSKQHQLQAIHAALEVARIANHGDS